MFGYIEISGRVINYFTKQPVTANVQLVIDVPTASSFPDRRTICSVACNSDGTFTLKTKPYKKINAYLLFVDGAYYDQIKQIAQVFPKENQNNNMGTIIGGTHTFYCNLTLMPRSDSCIVVRKQIDSDQFINFNSGTTAQITLSTNYTYLDYVKSLHYYSVSCQTNDCTNTTFWGQTNRSITIPMDTISSIMSATIMY